MSKQENNKDFETSLKKLEQIVSDLENGELPLEQSIKTFEEGVKLTKHCQNLLSKAELKIQKLVESKDGSIDLEAFEDE
ncbi:MAG: exodeoxyribonuclease VII small subunit [Pseudomonadota bacterium]|nr:exodeoxyribonuclease VII small subunit [Pseudomonadota bacterium]MEC7465315.1 exodeoxyribonuclease VII small subunit [Pseudomonadota bacterium]MEC8108420.1 exodeoxyribonuclease VII small subunit [Pseudomonadota bacterium]MEC8169141.1 exodeoxyribonuclease VII small subunit [Pseudomonadota bacterium]MEC8377985.1 exodeoxyribonuclease VII small subunit [Pseudomonadota bacterium]|tara:strand:+ start:28 stop:264 length:237 start_codon:yes stop_codon:yes gene_type:complete